LAQQQVKELEAKFATRLDAAAKRLEGLSRDIGE
jgi:hypothetical protein